MGKDQRRDYGGRPGGGPGKGLGEGLGVGLGEWLGIGLGKGQGCVDGVGAGGASKFPDLFRGNIRWTFYSHSRGLL